MTQSNPDANANTETKQEAEKRYYHLSAEAGLPETERELESLLEDDGARRPLARRSTAVHDGVVLTWNYVHGLWNHESGYDACGQQESKTHRDFLDLTPEEQETFASVVAGYMLESVTEGFLLYDSIGSTWTRAARFLPTPSGSRSWSTACPRAIRYRPIRPIPKKPQP